MWKLMYKLPRAEINQNTLLCSVKQSTVTFAVFCSFLGPNHKLFWKFSSCLSPSILQISPQTFHVFNCEARWPPVRDLWKNTHATKCQRSVRSHATPPSYDPPLESLIRHRYVQGAQVEREMTRIRQRGSVPVCVCVRNMQREVDESLTSGGVRVSNELPSWIPPLTYLGEGWTDGWMDGWGNNKERTGEPLLKCFGFCLHCLSRQLVGLPRHNHLSSPLQPCSHCLEHHQHTGSDHGNNSEYMNKEETHGGCRFWHHTSHISSKVDSSLWGKVQSVVERYISA